MKITHKMAASIGRAINYCLNAHKTQYTTHLQKRIEANMTLTKQLDAADRMLADMPPRRFITTPTFSAESLDSIICDTSRPVAEAPELIRLTPTRTKQKIDVSYHIRLTEMSLKRLKEGFDQEENKEMSEQVQTFFDNLVKHAQGRPNKMDNPKKTIRVTPVGA